MVRSTAGTKYPDQKLEGFLVRGCSAQSCRRAVNEKIGSKHTKNRCRRRRTLPFSSIVPCLFVGVVLQAVSSCQVRLSFRDFEAFDGLDQVR